MPPKIYPTFFRPALPFQKFLNKISERNKYFCNLRPLSNTQYANFLFKLILW